MTSANNKYRLQELIVLSFFLLFLLSSHFCKSLEETPLLITVDHMEFVSEGSYKVTGTMASLGDKEILEQGMCWSESHMPDLECSSETMELTPSVGEFNNTASGLSSSTTYYF